MAFLRADEKTLALLILRALPLTLDRAALLAEMDLTADDIPDAPVAGAHAFDELKAIRDAIFNRRQGVNRDEKGQTQAADHLRLNSPAVFPVAATQKQLADLEEKAVTLAADLAADEEAAEAAQREAIEAARTTHLTEDTRAWSAFKEAEAKLNADHDASAAALRAEVEKKIAADRQATDDTVAALRESTAHDTADLIRVRNEAEDKAREDLEAAKLMMQARRSTLAQAREQLAKGRVEMESSTKTKALLDQAKDFDTKAERLRLESEKLTRALDALDAHRRRLLANLPVPGLEIDGTTTRVDGKPFDQVNTARRLEVAVALACLRTKRLPIVFVDDAEHLDSEHLAALKAELTKRGVQAFVARVDDGPFNIASE